MKNRLEPRRSSTRGPKKYSASMLKKMCPSPPWTNMYVMIVHGRRKIRSGTNARALVRPATVCWRKKTRTFAARKRVTHGVMMSPDAVPQCGSREHAAHDEPHVRRALGEAPDVPREPLRSVADQHAHARAVVSKRTLIGGPDAI